MAISLQPGNELWTPAEGWYPIPLPAIPVCLEHYMLVKYEPAGDTHLGFCIPGSHYGPVDTECLDHGVRFDGGFHQQQAADAGTSQVPD